MSAGVKGGGGYLARLAGRTAHTAIAPVPFRGEAAPLGLDAPPRRGLNEGASPRVRLLDAAPAPLGVAPVAPAAAGEPRSAVALPTRQAMAEPAPAVAAVTPAPEAPPLPPRTALMELWSRRSAAKPQGVAALVGASAVGVPATAAPGIEAPPPVAPHVVAAAVAAAGPPVGTPELGDTSPGDAGPGSEPAPPPLPVSRPPTVRAAAHSVVAVPPPSPTQAPPPKAFATQAPPPPATIAPVPARRPAQGQPAASRPSSGGVSIGRLEVRIASPPPPPAAAAAPPARAAGSGAEPARLARGFRAFGIAQG